MQQHRVIQDEAKYMEAARPLFAGKLDDTVLSSCHDILQAMSIWDPNEARWSDDAGGELTSKTLADFQAVEKYVPFARRATTQFTDAARQTLDPYKA